MGSLQVRSLSKTPVTMYLLLIIAIIIIGTPIFALFMTAMSYREDQDWQSKREDYLSGKL